MLKFHDSTFIQLHDTFYELLHPLSIRQSFYFVAGFIDFGSIFRIPNKVILCFASLPPLGAFQRADIQLFGIPQEAGFLARFLIAREPGNKAMQPIPNFLHQ